MALANGINANLLRRWMIEGGQGRWQVLAECRQPGASVSAVAIAHGLNTNVVRKWLTGRGLKRMALLCLQSMATRLTIESAYARSGGVAEWRKRVVIPS
ncbi:MULTISPECIES: hypothetical protein [unclassified Variovorax]|uniref:hypothetical protein n=1 Tax=unclassified Variovorax TaxID=663243 RepID=UPI00076C99F8|nr:MULTISPECIES: hypothetical protein [unclassified Variovorax]KWT90177.1 hypothetical protein APY03_3271 [Variovorax sp. WDL1]PNG55508.1 hypothetical protein CHC07_01916 [Variovorax sp. B4]PNG56932.1 hypothetical protein CHC06_01919 [Variovorax sp. B2]VTV10793.1 Transposase [Variovorax sp. WDL1]